MEPPDSLGIVLNGFLEECKKSGFFDDDNWIPDSSMEFLQHAADYFKRTAVDIDIHNSRVLRGRGLFHPVAVYPKDVLYTVNHMWIQRVDSFVCRVGICRPLFHPTLSARLIVPVDTGRVSFFNVLGNYSDDDLWSFYKGMGDTMYMPKEKNPSLTCVKTRGHITYRAFDAKKDFEGEGVGESRCVVITHCDEDKVDSRRDQKQFHVPPWTFLYSPVSGRLKKFNEKLFSRAELVNSDPFGDGWLFEIYIDSEEEIDYLRRRVPRVRIEYCDTLSSSEYRHNLSEQPDVCGWNLVKSLNGRDKYEVYRLMPAELFEFSEFSKLVSK